MKQKELKERALPFIRAGLLAVGIAFIAAGVVREEHLTVLRKAINICLECIGIG